MTSTTINTEDLMKSAILLKRISPFLRIDIWPFISIYGLCLYLIFTSSERVTGLRRSEISYLLSRVVVMCDQKQIGFIVMAIALFSHVVLYMIMQSSSVFKSKICYRTILGSKLPTTSHLYKEDEVLSADLVIAIPSNATNKSAIVPLIHVQKSRSYFSYFSYNETIFDFNKKKSQFERRLYPTKGSLKEFQDSKGHTSKSAEDALTFWGKNELEFPIPDFIDLFLEQVVSPFFVFQTTCLVLWSLDDYWYYSLFTFLMLLVFECMMCKQRESSLLNLSAMRMPPFDVLVYREGWAAVKSNEIVPGDLISLSRVECASDNDALSVTRYIPCDLLLVNGNCVTNEAMLTGETMHQLKEGVNSEESIDDLNLGDLTSIDESMKKCILFAGTSLISCSGSENWLMGQPKVALENKNVGCYGIVLQTGFGTLQVIDGHFCKIFF
jgi:manganese-transporting P-type ATPase